MDAEETLAIAPHFPRIDVLAIERLARVRKTQV